MSLQSVWIIVQTTQEDTHVDACRSRQGAVDEIKSRLADPFYEPPTRQAMVATLEALPAAGGTVPCPQDAGEKFTLFENILGA